MTSRRYAVTLVMDVDVYTERDVAVSEDEIQQRLAHGLRDWNDGRYRFSTELVQDGMRRAFESAFAGAVEAPFRERHGNKCIGGHLVAGYLADKAVEGLYINTSSAGPEVISVIPLKDDDR